MWETLNGTYHALPGRIATARSVGPNTFFRYVKERAAIIAGLVDSTLCATTGGASSCSAAPSSAST